jgi:hypothetical protein
MKHKAGPSDAENAGIFYDPFRKLDSEVTPLQIIGGDGAQLPAAEVVLTDLQVESVPTIAPSRMDSDPDPGKSYNDSCFDNTCFGESCHLDLTGCSARCDE